MGVASFHEYGFTHLDESIEKFDKSVELVKTMNVLNALINTNLKAVLSAELC